MLTQSVMAPSAMMQVGLPVCIMALLDEMRTFRSDEGVCEKRF
jgi:hypothetical protein